MKESAVVDVVHEINAVRRQVGTRQLEAGEARTITISRTYDATPEEVWDACTNPERVPRWFLPISGELRVGGRYHLEGNASGTIERCDPPRSFVATWEYSGEVSWIELRLSAVPGGGTRLELQHIAHIDDERWAQFGPGATGVGWELGSMGLGRYLASGEGLEPQAVAAWNVSEEGKRFMTQCSESWGEASIAAGTEPAGARAAADRTTAFYTADQPAATAT
jgi:uncharacterized protein YndB with AHSA1/START domain